MIIKELEVQHFRSIQQLIIQPHPRLNVIEGNNGAGKSSLLEAIECLSSGRSFRSNKTRELVQHQNEHYFVRGLFINPATEKTHRAGLEKSIHGKTNLKLDFDVLQNQSALCKLLPVKSITPDSHHLIQFGPDYRRQFLDWGLFHVEPEFHTTWQRFRKALSQRNSALKNSGSCEDVQIWDQQLAYQGELMTTMRVEYLTQLESILEKIIQQYDCRFHVKLIFKQGWPHEESLSDRLISNRQQHIKMKTTTDGPHRADISIVTEDTQAKYFLSRGQQKKLIYFLHLSQLKLLQERTAINPIILCDDTYSEFDEQAISEVTDALFNSKCQVFLSSVNNEIIIDKEHQRFHMKHGTLEKHI